MSMRLMAQAMSIKVGNPLRKLVLIKLADNANDDGICFPSYQYIADVCEISKASARNHIDDLINMGFVTKKARKNKDGSSSNLYILHLENGMPKNSLALLAEFGIVGQLADDFITHRKACKAPITKTALEGFQREADKLGMPIAESVAYAIERGWRGFKAEWYRRDLNNQPAEQMPANKPKFSNNQSGWSAGVEVEVDGQLWKF